MMGQVPTPLGVYRHNPKVLKASFAIGNKVQKWDTCDENLKSFAHMAVASLVGCTWCLDFNYFQAHNENLDLEKAREVPRWRDRKSTRLNSSHANISYAVFCLKKKNNNHTDITTLHTYTHSV